MLRHLVVYGGDKPRESAAGFDGSWSMFICYLLSVEEILDELIKLKQFLKENITKEKKNNFASPVLLEIGLWFEPFW